MKMIFFVLSLAAIFFLYILPTEIQVINVNEVEQHGEREVIIKGVLVNGKICSEKCVRVIGASGGGFKILRGTAVNRGGESLFFVRRIE